MTRELAIDDPRMCGGGDVATRGDSPDRAELARLVGPEGVRAGKPEPAKSSSCCSPATVTIGGKPSGTTGGCC
jgi:hypothetical protein